MTKHYLFLTVFSILFSISFSQTSIQEIRILKQYGITSKKIQCIIYNREQKDSLNYLAFTSEHNKMGYPLKEVRYKPDGSSTVLTCNYRDDSLKIKGIEKRNDSIIKELELFYDENRHLKSETFTDNIKNSKTTRIAELNNAGLPVKRYISNGSGSYLYSTLEYDDRMNMVKESFYSRQEEVVSVNVNEYDANNNLIRYYSPKNGVQTHQTEKKYNTDNLLIGETHTTSQRYKLWDIFGIEYHYDKGDRKMIQYVYDSRKLLIEQTEIVNDKVVCKLIFEYTK